MSSVAIRRKMETFAAGLGVPYYPTINEEQNPTDPLWMSLDFSGEYSEKTTFCNDQLEVGQIEFLFFANPGVGEQIIFSSIERVLNQVNLYQDDNLVLGAVQPLDDNNGSAENRWFEISCRVDYSYRK
jgi:hypothetical protein